MDVSQQLLNIEEGFWQAAGDRDRYAEHLAADALHVFPGWGVAPRDAVLPGSPRRLPGVRLRSRILRCWH